MIPKTKIQKEIAAVQATFPGITKTQEEWGMQHCMPHFAYRLASGHTTCLDCAHEWQEDCELSNILEINCPGCGVKLKIENTKKRVHNYSAYYTIISTYKGYQVISLYLIYGTWRKGLTAEISCRTISQTFIKNTGEYVPFGLIKSGFSYADCWGGQVELRGHNAAITYNMTGLKIYPKINIIPVLKRAGLTKEAFIDRNHGLYDLQPFTIMKRLMLDSRIETLYKTKQFKLFSLFDISDKTDKQTFEQLWPSIKIAIRNKYIVQKAKDWRDYISLLKQFNRDVLNPKYVCPENLNKEHNRYVQKRQRLLDKENLEKQLARIVEDQIQYEKDKGHFFDLIFEENGIKIEVLKHVKDFYWAGKQLKHCVYTNKYYQDKNSLILMATIEGKLIETIEVDFYKFSISQSRGIQNQPTEYNKSIVAIVKNNMAAIKKIAKKKKHSLEEFQPINNEVAA